MTPTDPTDEVHVWVPVSQTLLDDAAAFGAMRAEVIDRWANPWRYPDRTRIPTIDLFPRWTRLAGAINEARERITHAIDTLRHGVPEEADQ